MLNDDARIVVYSTIYLFNLHIILGTSLGDDDVIILAPPPTLSVTEGDAVSLPCVGSGGTPPIFVVNGTGVQSPAVSGPYSLDFASIALSDAGTYTCQIGSTNATVTLNVTAMLGELTFTREIFRPWPIYFLDKNFVHKRRICCKTSS